MERVEVGGLVQALTHKAALINDSGAERWLPRKFFRVVAGELARGCWVVLSVPLWLIDKQERGGASPTPSAPSSGAGIPAQSLLSGSCPSVPDGGICPSVPESFASVRFNFSLAKSFSACVTSPTGCQLIGS